MNTELLQHEEFGELRMQEVDGEPWFVAKDICQALQMKQKVDSSLRKLDEDEKRILSVSVSGQKREVWCVNESGLYQLIFKSRKAKAKEFTRWVTSEVLPSIRKTGVYAKPPSLGNQVSFPELESYKGELCISFGWLVQAGVASQRAISNQIDRGNIVKLRRSCKGMSALLVYNTLPLKYRQKLEAMYGLPKMPSRHAYKYTHAEMLELINHILQPRMTKAKIVNKLLARSDVDQLKIDNEN